SVHRRSAPLPASRLRAGGRSLSHPGPAHGPPVAARHLRGAARGEQPRFLGGAPGGAGGAGRGALRWGRRPARRRPVRLLDGGEACGEQRAAWCDVSAPFDGSPNWTAEDLLAGAWNGVAVLDHPSNSTFPTPWRVDRQGLINPSPSLLGDWHLEPGEDQVFR